MECKNCEHYDAIANNSCKLGLFRFDTCSDFKKAAYKPHISNEQEIIALYCQGVSIGVIADRIYKNEKAKKNNSVKKKPIFDTVKETTYNYLIKQKSGG